MMRRFPALAGLVALAVVGGCGMAYPTALGATPSPITSSRPATPSTRASPTRALTPSPGGPSAEIEISISGGPHAGSYRSVAPDGCDSKPAQNSFTVTYASDAAADGFVALHLVLRDAARAQEDESNDFEAQISLGGAGAGISYTIDPLNGASSGTALLEIAPFDATLDLTAHTPDGARLELTVICGSP